MSLNRAFKKAEEDLAEGFNVSFGRLGHIQLSINGEGVDVPAKVRPSLMKRIKPNFIFGGDIKRRLQKIDLEEFPEA